jgi:superfamily I DNA/RNA helicase
LKTIKTSYPKIEKMPNPDKYQVKYITHKDGHSVVIAGPGSGKTTCIVERVKCLFDRKKDREKIAVVTFTNQAANELKDRLLLELEPADFSCLQVSTLHSFGWHVYQGCNKDFNDLPILGQEEQNLILSQILDQFGIKGEYKKEVLQKYLNYKNKNTNIDIYDNIVDREIYQLIKQMHELYCKVKDKRKFYDFDDLVNIPFRFFKKNPEICKKERAKFQEIIVDEAQDLNINQYLFLMLLGRKVSFVGDYDQSIYRWRGADPEIIERFIEEYKPSVYKLKYNYRSSLDIIKASSSLIKNTSPFYKAMETPNEFTGQIDFFKFKKFTEQSHFLIKKILKMINEENIDPGEIAVLSRINIIQNIFKEMLKNKGIQFRVNEVDLLTKKEQPPLFSKKQIVLSTIHNAKGKQWENVFMLGFTENILPLRKNYHLLDINEERNLCYVALTRAKKRIFICHSQQMEFLNNNNYKISRFFYDIKDEVEHQNLKNVKFHGFKIKEKNILEKYKKRDILKELNITF